MKKNYLMTALMAVMTIGLSKAQSFCAAPTFTASKVDAKCNGETNGSVGILIPTRFLGFYSEVKVSLLKVVGVSTSSIVSDADVDLVGTNAGQWNSGNVLGAGNYRIELAYVCISTGTKLTVTRSVRLSELSPFTVTLPASRDVCARSVNSNTRIDAIVNGRPVTTTQYIWSNSSTNTLPYINVSTTGIYTVTVTDAFGCMASASTTVTASNGPALVVNSTPDDCGTKNGSAQVSATSTNTPLTYEWSNSARTPNISNLAQGGYTVSVTDSKVCISTANADVPLGNNCVRKIKGIVVNDVNNNCNVDGSDTRVSSNQVKLTYNAGRNTKVVMTNSLGEYEFNLEPSDLGPFQVTPISNSSTNSCSSISNSCVQSYSIPSIGLGQEAINKNFYYTSNNTSDVSVSLSCGGQTDNGWFSQTYRSDHKITVRNLGCNRANGKATLYQPNTPRPVLGTFDFNLAPGESKQFSVNETYSQNIFSILVMNCNKDYMVRAEAVVYNVTDANMSNNSVECTYRGCPLDPNNKMVNPVRSQEGGIFESDTKLNYVVNFQNLGNAEATYVRVEDVLDLNKYEIESFDFLGSSHPSSWEFINNKLVVTMRGLHLLPKDLDEEGSKGYISFTIKRKEGMPLGTAIDNTAAIYFDYNDPVITNTAHSVIISPLSNETAVVNREENLILVPNPTSSSATAVVNLVEATSVNLSVFNINGQLVKNIATDGVLQAGTHKINLDVDALASGAYIIQFKSATSVVTQKLIKQ